MSHTYCAQFAHVVFSTKDRRDLIPSGMQSRVNAYVAGIIRKLGLQPLAIGGTENHLHILIMIPASARLAEAVQKIKANSSRWVGDQGVKFEWQRGYGAFSVSPSMLRVVKRYIENQEEHHRARSFDEEFLMLLRKSGVRFEEREALG